MKLTEARKLLIDISHGLNENGATKASIRIREFADCLPVKGTSKVADLPVIVSGEVGSSGKVLFGSPASTLADGIAAFLPAFKRMATASKFRALESLKDFVANFSDMPLDDFIKQLRSALEEPTDIVDYYVSRLFDRYKDGEKFPVLFEKLKSDRRVNKDAAVKIAQKFSKFGKTGTKAAALESIWNKHYYYIDGKKSGAAMGGKSAA